jgi:hypothetical protein
LSQVIDLTELDGRGERVNPTQLFFQRFNQQSGIATEKIPSGTIIVLTVFF